MGLRASGTACVVLAVEAGSLRREWGEVCVAMLLADASWLGCTAGISSTRLLAVDP